MARHLPARFIDSVIEWRKIIFNRNLLGSIVLAVIMILTLDQAYEFRTRSARSDPRATGL